MADHQLRRRSDRDSSEPPPVRVLIVDDDDHYRAYLSALGERFGFESAEAVDGEDAMAKLRGGSRYDLLIVDCEMPRLNGLDFISAVRADERYKDLHAVMLTAREDVQTKITALRLGYDDYIIKSADELEITAKLSAARRLIARQQRLDTAMRELYGLATRDELTGLYNRRFFFAEAERILAEGTEVSLVLFDLDDFKRINDNFGHLAGDRMLHDIGSLFISHTRHEDLIARYGGDEFVMLIVGMSAAQVEAFSIRLSQNIASRQWLFGDELLSVGVTSGFACSSLLPSPTLAQLLSAGDRDLYKNKWVRKHPDVDPSLYQYDSTRGAHVLEFVNEITASARRKG